ncbi:BZ3500_MvSof-1268-A1-R1_Chr1-3g02397 [Microbotryum saponariae]|uniref:BZ3500_MvSof-1268-A1-R1_Chr1-3g02397 protein n=1 Tax=Microbotryum saponariae TaxID=289078 RepID=A0A2X0MG44_9BASI|nr:BZ3500_MvSof-1268-A1-R1_Chr1-3g02397 [Microbotryum saponariae]SCZ96184.1 BZ3501_MvSof-1269-A2-R1_Chr1-3g02000 [Microbotryum saponariae]
MGIRGLDSWLAEASRCVRTRGLIKEMPLSELRDTRLGIDVNHYLKRMLTPKDPSTADAFVAALGGSPLAMAAEIIHDLKVLESFKCIPVFVFNGLPLQERERPFLYDEPKGWRRQAAWDHYEQGRVTQAQAEFAASNSVATPDIIRFVHRLFKPRHVETVIAPYLAWPQLVYLERHERQYVHALYGSTELFMFDGIDRIILDINFKTGQVSFSSKLQILAEMGLNSEQFLDLAILAGFDLSPTFPAIDPRDFQLRSVIDLIKQRGAGTTCVMAFKDFPPVFQSNYIDQFARARAMIKFSLVLVANEGRVLPLPLTLPPAQPSSGPVITPSDIPHDLGDIFSAHFPDEVYYQMFRGLILPQVLHSLASGHVIESSPLCGGTPEYDRFVKSLIESPHSPRCVALALVSSVLHPLWAKKSVTAIYYFDPTREYPIPHSSPHATAFLEGVSKWNVDARHVEDELRRQSSSTIDLSLCLGGTATQSLSQRTIVPKNADCLLEKKDEIVANTLWRFLELRAFLTASHQHTPHAQAIFAAMRQSRVNDKFQDALFLAMELLRAGALHNGKIGTRPYSGGPNFQGSEEDKRSMLLVMRVLSIVPLSNNALPWTGPLSRELLVFNSFIRATSRSMRLLLESILLNLMLRSDARRARHDYLDIAVSLPFQTDTNTGMGILFKAYGDAVCHLAGGVQVVTRSGHGTQGEDSEEGKEVKEAKEQTLSLLDDAFPNVKNVTSELQRGFRFWQMMMIAIRSLKQFPAGVVISPDLVNQFEQADAWLAPFHL